MEAIQIQNLTKSFNHIQAVRGINLSIRQGEIFSLLGPNGAGKSTTISMVSGLLTPDSGDALIFGKSIRKETVQAQKQVGVVPQEIAIYTDLSARQNLMFWGRMAGLSGKLLSRRVDEVLELVELTDRQRGDSGKFSGGMKRRLNIAIALLHQPALLILDEPTVGIDPQSRRKILDSVKVLRDQGTTILYTTHYMEEAQELSDRIAIMDEGKIIACGTQAELVQRVGEQDHIVLKVTEAKESDLVRMGKSLNGSILTLKDEQTIEVLAHKGWEVLPMLFTACNQSGVKVTAVEIQEANLEMVFLQLTGKALRD
jgi:ABC-2 type transport system ATP-binding protein